MGFLSSSDRGLNGGSLPVGLRLRLVSERRPDGERERRSKRDDRFGSGSV